MKTNKHFHDLNIFEYVSNKEINRIYGLTLSKKKLKCWFCNSEVETVIGFCELCKYEKLSNVKKF
jgi:hypothetical protein